MGRLFYGYFGWMCYDCRKTFNSFWVGLWKTITGKCCKER